MRPAYKYCLMSFLATLPVTVPYALEGMYYEFRLDLYIEICIQRAFNGIKPVYCAFEPSKIPRATVYVAGMASVFSILSLPIAFPIVYGIVRLRSWWIARRDDDAPPPGSDAPAGAPDA